jgi:hypothetical protein
LRLTDNIVQICSARHGIGRVLVQWAKVRTEVSLGFNRHVLLSAEEDHAFLSDKERTV